MRKKIHVAVLFGGKSAEHEVSIRSAKHVVAALDPKRYEVTAIKISRTQPWLPAEDLLKSIDVVFPILHGPFGEDGTMQGLLKLANVPFVGPSVLGSAVGMDKDVTKRLLRDAGIPTSKFLTATKSDQISFAYAKKNLGLPVFIKPANMGSSVGVHKVTNKREFDAAIKNALKFDRKILIEAFIKGRELECAVLGNEKPIASIVGEIIPHHEFYSYEAKYLDENGAGLEIPAKIPRKIEKRIQELAIQTFKTLGCEGMSRVDFFLKDNGDVLVNEINTIPGFTSISMFPMLWEASGIPPKKLVDTLISLAIARHKRDAKLKTSY
ncbi:MAG TPA: D-alanine--D-alanine ligase family protein [Candidatus Paceibacterota bacterium]|nr:D-alanine--D-alanine ligase family protein [Candidatus Paceibacterota bacterium]